MQPVWITCIGGDSSDGPARPVVQAGGQVLVAWSATVVEAGAAAPRRVIGAEVVLARVSAGSITILRRWPLASAGSPTSSFAPHVQLWPAPRGGAFLRVEEGGGTASRVPLSIDVGGGPHLTPYTVELDENGTFLRDLCAEGCDDIEVAASRDGVLVLATRTGDAVRVERVGADGSRVLLWARDGSGAVTGPASAGCGPAALAPDGDVICAGTVWGPIEGGSPPATPSEGRNPVIARVGPDGAPRWTFSIPGIDAVIADVGITGDGETVVAGSFVGRAEVAGQVLSCGPVPMQGSGSGFIVRLTSDGTPRWARMSTGEIRGAAVAADGSVAVLANSELRGVWALRFFAGDGKTASDWETADDLKNQVTGVAAGPDRSWAATVTYRNPAAPPGSGLPAYHDWDIGVLWFGAPREP